MILKELALKNFRVFSEVTIDFIDGINILTGMNGQGKSSILEAIYYLALTRSFRTNSDYNAIQYETKSFDITGNFFTNPDKSKQVRLYYSQAEGKNVFVGEKRLTSFSEHVGTIPCIVLTLADTKLIYGNPAERRRFMDVLLSQTSPVYLQDLKNFRRVLQQRNSLLQSGNIKMIKDQIPSWNKQLVESGSAIIARRLLFLSFLNENLSSCYLNLAGKNTIIDSVYLSSIGVLPVNSTEDDLRLIFQRALKHLADKELEKGTTICGPHRDDVDFNYNKKSFRDYCSQGEIKTLVIALKLLEWEYVKNYRQVDPILLLDDIFGEIDQDRMNKLLMIIRHVGQAFITTTLMDKFALTKKDSIFNVKDSKIYHA